MAETMYDYYQSQPQYMKRIVAKKDALFGAFGEFYAKAAPDRVYLCGSGSSYHASEASQEFMEVILGVEVSVIVPSQYRSLGSARPLVIAVSQSGRSINTLSALRDMKEKGAALASLTGWADSPIGRAADCSVALDIDEELVSPKTKGFTATIASLYLMTLAAGLASGSISRAEYDKWLEAIAASVEAGEDNQRACKEFFDRHLESLKKAKSYLFVGKGIGARVAGEAALKVLETIYVPSSAYEFEEYLHGPIYYMEKGMALFITLPEDEDKERAIRLSDMIRDISPNVYLVSYDQRLKGDNILNLRAADSYYMIPFSAVFPGQLVSSLIPAEMGITEHPIVRKLFDAMSIKTALPPRE